MAAGTDTAHLFDGVVVAFVTPGGESKIVGPPGSKTDLQDERLSLPDPSLTAHGARRWAWLEIGSCATREAAVVCGAVWLAEDLAKARPPRDPMQRD